MGGIRFVCFFGEGEFCNIWEKFEDCVVINEFFGCIDSVFLYFFWDKVLDFSELKEKVDVYGIKWVLVNLNIF